MRNVVGCALALALAHCAGAVAVDGNWEVVVPAMTETSGLPQSLYRAAQAFTNAFREATGEHLPLVAAGKRKPGKPAILLGEEAARVAGLLPERELKGFDNVIAEKGGDIYLFGRDRAIHKGKMANTPKSAPMPTVRALTRFMETYMDVRFLAPGEIGMDVPKADKVVVPDGVCSREDPKLEYGPVSTQADPLYDYANNIFRAGSYYSYGGHSYPKACPPSKYFKDHPEYFGLVGGRRVGSDEKNPTLCISNPEVQQLMVDELIRRFDDGADVVQLAQQDGWQFCECEACKRFGGPGAEYIGEKLWILHRQIAERILKERPGKVVNILCYSATLEPPKTFRKFPSNVMVELCHLSQKQLDQWRAYEVPRGFVAYIYMWGSYQPLGFCPKRSWMRCRDFAKLMIDNGVRGIYRCGYGELFGLEGPAYYVFNRTLSDTGIDVMKTVEEYCARAFGPEAAQPMYDFFEAFDKRLRGLNLMEGDLDAGALRPTKDYRDAYDTDAMAQIAYVFSPNVLERMEWKLKTAEQLAKTHKQRKRLELVRTEFAYVKNLAQTVTAYAAFRTKPTKGTLEPVLDLVEARNKYLDSVFSINDTRPVYGGIRARSIDGWPELRLFNYAERKLINTNGRLLATLGSPFGWDPESVRRSGVIPGKEIKEYAVSRADVVSEGFDFESGAWASAAWAEIAGLQMEKVRTKARFKVLAGRDALYLAIESDLAEGAPYTKMTERDAKAWSTESLDVMISPRADALKRVHVISCPSDGGFWDARFGYLTDPFDPRYRSDDDRWNGAMTIRNKVAGGVWKQFVRLPYADLGVDAAPKAGETWRLNVGRQANMHGRPRMPELLLWNPNVQSRSFNVPDVMGRLKFK